MMAGVTDETAIDEALLPPALCVLGLGLIGGSLVRAATSRMPVLGWSPSEATRAGATADGYRVFDEVGDALTAAAESDALVVMAAPVTAFAELLDAINDVAPEVRLTDVAGVKESVAEQVVLRAPHTRYVGSHPMAGTQHSGWAAGTADLFAGAAWVTCLDEDTPISDWATIAALALALGSRVVPVEATAHDQAVARISHLPHLLALALAQTGAAGGPLALSLAAGSFGDGTRVAATRPDLIRAMCESNRDALVTAVDDALGILGVARGSLASTGSLAKLTEAGHAGRVAFEQRGTDLRPTDLVGDDLVDELLAVGSAGGHVSGIVRAPTGLRVRAWFPLDD